MSENKQHDETADENEHLLSPDTAAKILKWCENAKNFNLPKWEELPEIDLYMDQVIVLMEKYLKSFLPDVGKQITASMINNYVKMKVIPSPKKKKYSRMHLAYLIILCILKQALSISEISALMKSHLEFDTIENIFDRFSEHYLSTFTNFSKKIANELNETCKSFSAKDADSAESREEQSRAEYSKALNNIIINNASTASAGRLIASNILNFTSGEEKE